MELIRFHCPSCGHLLVVPPEAAGQSGPCPSCQTIIRGPQAPATAEPEPSPLPPPPEPESRPPSAEPPSSPPPAGSQAPATPAPLIDTETPVREPAQAFDFNFDDESAERQVRKASQSAGGVPLLAAAGIATLCSVIFFGMGFFFGRSGNFTRPLEQPRASESQSLEVPTPAAPPKIAPVTLPTEPLPTVDQSGAMAALEAFLSARSWAARSAYVRDADRVLPLMETDAQQNGDGPVPYDSLELVHDAPQLKIFALKTLRHPLPFNVAVVKNDIGWSVDWEGFQDFYNDSFETFARGGKGPTKGIFRLFLKPAPGESDPLNPARFIVSAMHSTNTYQVSTQQDSEVRKQLSQLLKRSSEEEPGELRNALEGAGLPFMLELSRTGSVNPSLKLERVAAFSWLTPIE